MRSSQFAQKSVGQSDATISKKGNIHKVKRNDLLFYILMMAFPILQFTIFYIVVNSNAIMLAFKRFERPDYVWNGFNTIVEAFKSLTQDEIMLKTGLNSLILYSIGLLVGIPLGLLFSYFIFKKIFLSGAFRVLLFMPSIISSIVMVIIYKYFVENAIPEVYNIFTGREIDGLLSNIDTRFGAILFYNIWISFGVSILMYSGAMNSIDTSIIESAKVEGVKNMQEFFHICLPMIYPTIVTFVVVGISGIFTNQMNLYHIYGGVAPQEVWTFGYYLFKLTNDSTRGFYPKVSAMGLLMTGIAVPLTLGAKFLLEKFGPKID